MTDILPQIFPETFLAAKLSKMLMRVSDAAAGISRIPYFAHDSDGWPQMVYPLLLWCCVY